MKRNLTLFVVIFLALAITLSLAGCEIISGSIPEDDLTDNSQENENGNEEPEIEYSEGLRYELSRDGKSYIVKVSERAWTRTLRSPPNIAACL